MGDPRCNVAKDAGGQCWDRRTVLGSEASWKVFASDKLGTKERGHQPHREQGGRKQSEDHLGDKNAHRLRCGEFPCD